MLRDLYVGVHLERKPISSRHAFPHYLDAKSRWGERDSQAVGRRVRDDPRLMCSLTTAYLDKGKWLDGRVLKFLADKWFSSCWMGYCESAAVDCAGKAKFSGRYPSARIFLRPRSSTKKHLNYYVDSHIGLLRLSLLDVFYHVDRYDAVLMMHPSVRAPPPKRGCAARFFRGPNLAQDYRSVSSLDKRHLQHKPTSAESGLAVFMWVALSLRRTLIGVLVTA